MFVFMYMCICVYIHICVYAYMSTCIYVYMYMRATYVCIYVYMYICIHDHMYLYDRGMIVHMLCLHWQRSFLLVWLRIQRIATAV